MSKGLETLKFLRRNYCILKSERERACDTIEKELKAFDILKKNICLDRAFSGRCGVVTLRNILIEIKALVTDEEYALIREVL